MSHWDRLISTIGGARFITGLGGFYVLLAAGQAIRNAMAGSPIGEILVEFSVFAAPGIALVYGGYRLPQTDLTSNANPRIVGWCLAGFSLMLGIVVLLVLNPGGSVDRPLRAAGIATALGSVGGFAIGLNEARALTRAEEAEQRTRELTQYGILIEEATDVNAILDSDGTFQYLTPSVEHVLGYARDELIGEDAGRYLHPDDRDEVIDTLIDAVSPGDRSETMEFRVKHEDGSWVVLEGQSRNLLDDPVIEGMVAYTHDVTERKEYERDLQQYKTVAETASDIIVMIDEQSRIQSVNPAIEEVFGYSREALIGDSLTTLMPEPLRDRHRDALQNYLQTGERTLDWENIELPGLHRDGHEVPLAISFSEFEQDGDRYFTGIIRDNTKRKELEDELRQERDLRDRIFETSPTGILVVGADGAISFVNAYAAELLGLPEEQISDLESLLSTVQVTAPERGPTEGDIYRQVLSTGDSIYDLERQITRPDGQQIWTSVNGAPLRDPDGEVSAVVFTLDDITERKHYQAQLISLNELSQDLTDAETEQAVSELVVEVARDTLGLSLIAIAMYDEEHGRLRYTARTSAVTELVGDATLFEPERGLPWQVFSDQNQAVHDDLLEQADITESETPLRSAMLFPLGEHGVFIGGATTTEAFSAIDVSLAQMVVANTRSALDRVEREQTVRTQRDTLAEQNTALERVQRINSTIRGITTDLVQAATREEIVQASCDRLAAADAYRFAWIGTHDPVTAEVIPEAWAGAEDGYLETITVTADDEDRREPTGEAVRSHETQVRNELAAQPPFKPWQQAALDRGFQASIAVPLVYQDTLYGVLTLYAGQPDVFNRMEEAVLTELGETIGYALNALERKRALVSEQSVELEFQLRSGDPPLFRFAAEHDCEFTFENIVQRADGPPGIFFTIRGVSPGEVLAFGEDSPEITELTLVSEREDEALFEARLRDSAFFSALLDRGAMPQTLTATGDEGYAVIRVPRTSNIRAFVELFEAQYEVVELVGRREVDEPIKTQQEFEAEFRQQLTERQEEILKTAYVSGFFDWPRAMSAQDLAEMLELSQPTVSRHIRAGERKLFGLVFGEE